MNHLQKSINCRGKLISLSSPLAMAILNITPDSFYDGGQNQSIEAMLRHVEKMLKDGATILDIGGMSTRPGAEIIPGEEELKRVIPAVEAITKAFPEAILSIDTLRASVADTALNAGAHIINDISAGLFDPNMLDTVAGHKAPYVLMHMQGEPATMQDNPVYKNVVSEVYDFLKARIDACTTAGINDIIIDPGFGFGKTVEHNYTLLRNLQYFAQLNTPILAGVSRKSMICKVLKVNPDKALTGTIAANTIALLNGANILRVHDVKEAMETIKIVAAYRQVPI